MSANGNGGTHEPDGDRAMQACFDAALAAMPDRDRVDRLAVFAATQSDALLRMIELLGRRIDLLEAELARLRAQQRRDRRVDLGGEDEDGLY
jgi:uncharacterized small protein (DUF1192 family)